MEKETPKVVNEEDKLYALLNKCNNADKPDAKAREELHRLINTNACCKDLMQRQNSIYSVILRTRIESLNSSDTFKEVMYAKCNQLREQLGYPTANRLEKLAIEQIVLCWVNYHQTELLHAGILAKSNRPETGIYWEKRLSFASQRYNRALNILSKMRKMNLVLQVNTATNQIVSNSNQHKPS